VRGRKWGKREKEKWKSPSGGSNLHCRAGLSFFATLGHGWAPSVPGGRFCSTLPQGASVAAGGRTLFGTARLAP
jgi:hypothetical protein